MSSLPDSPPGVCTPIRGRPHLLPLSDPTAFPTPTLELPAPTREDPARETAVMATSPTPSTPGRADGPSPDRRPATADSAPTPPRFEDDLRRVVVLGRRSAIRREPSSTECLSRASAPFRLAQLRASQGASPPGRPSHANLVQRRPATRRVRSPLHRRRPIDVVADDREAEQVAQLVLQLAGREALV